VSFYLKIRKALHRGIASLICLLFLPCASSVFAAQVCPGNVGASLTPTSAFVVNPAGTVKHATTGLMWKQCVEGLSGASCTVGTVSLLVWAGALSAATTSTFAGFTDWRLPNKRELESLVDITCYSPAINIAVFPENGVFVSSNEATWTSTTAQSTPTFAINVEFRYGSTNSEQKVAGINPIGTSLVRLVRGGAAFDRFATSALPACSLDVNGDGATTADKDAVLLLRYLMGFRGDELVAGVPLGAARPNAQAVQNFIGSALQFDVFGRTVASVTSLQDGLVLTRLMLGVGDDALLTALSVPGGAAFSSAFAVRTNVNERCGTNY
jgi:hypothetical protein